MKKYIFSIILSLSAAVTFAQTYTIDIDSVQVIGTDLFFDVRVKGSANFNLGFADIKLAYEKSKFNSPVISRVANSQKTVDASGTTTTTTAHSMSGVFTRDSKLTLIMNGSWVQEAEQFTPTAVIGATYVRLFKMKVTNFTGTTVADAGLIFVKKNSVFYKVGSDFKYTKLVYQ